MSDNLTTDVDTESAQRRRRPPLVTRPQAIAAAYDLVAESGSSGLSMRKLAASLHVSLPTVYTAVASKEDLVDRLVERLVAEIGMALTPVAQSPGSANERFERLVGTVVRWAHDNPNLAEFLLQSTLGAEVPAATAAGVGGELQRRLSADLGELLGDLSGLDIGVAVGYALVQLRATLVLIRERALESVDPHRWEQIGAATLLEGLRLLAANTH